MHGHQSQKLYGMGRIGRARLDKEMIVQEDVVTIWNG